MLVGELKTTPFPEIFRRKGGLRKNPCSLVLQHACEEEMYFYRGSALFNNKVRFYTHTTKPYFF